MLNEQLVEERRDVDVISWDAIERLCPVEADEWLAVLGKYELTEEIFASIYWPDAEKDVLASELKHLIDGNPTVAAAQLIGTWNQLRQAFARATRVGDSHLTLGIGYQEPDDADDDDYEHDEDKVCYTVSGARQLSPAGEKFNSDITQAFGVWQKCKADLLAV
jgi:hypothetical protein